MLDYKKIDAHLTWKLLCLMNNDSRVGIGCECSQYTEYARLSGWALGLGRRRAASRRLYHHNIPRSA
jgi:hypothetical protein